MHDITPALIPAAGFVAAGIYALKWIWKDIGESDEKIRKALRIKQGENLPESSENGVPATTLSRDRR